MSVEFFEEGDIMQFKLRKLVAPIDVQLELTSQCNNRCFHCYNYWRGNEKQQYASMTDNDFLKVVDILHNAGVFYVTITGGEPFLVKPLLYSVLRKLAEKGIECDINSNLVNIDDDSVSVMKECGILSVLTSFHSSKKELHEKITNNPGSFSKTLRNIERIAHAGIAVEVNMVITKENFQDVYETCKLVKNFGAKGFDATRLQDSAREIDFSHLKLTVDEIRFAVEQLSAAANDLSVQIGSLTPYPFCFLANDKKFLWLSKRTCSAGITVASIEHTGFIRACPTSEMKYGHIFLDGLSKSWEEMKSWRNGTYTPPECNSCFYLPVCRGGCRAEGMKIGNINKRDELMINPIRDKVNGLISESAHSYNPEDEIVVCNRLKYRKEEFGYTVVGHRIKYPAFVSELVLETLLKFRNQGKLQIRDLVNEWLVDVSKIRDLFSLLEDRGIITKIKKKGGI